MVQFDSEKVKASIEEKEREVKELEAELSKQQKLSLEKKENQNKDIIELEQKIEGLRYFVFKLERPRRNRKQRFNASDKPKTEKPKKRSIS